MHLLKMLVKSTLNSCLNHDQLELTITDKWNRVISEELVLESSKTLGLQLVNSLINQLDGKNSKLIQVMARNLKLFFKN